MAGRSGGDARGWISVVVTRSVVAPWRAMMKPLRRIGWRRASAWVVLAGAVGCTPPATPVSTTGAPPTKWADTKVDTQVDTQVDAKVEPVATPVASADGERLDGRVMIASAEGGWTLRKAGTDMGGGSGVDGSSGSIGTIGKGGGTGHGRGYGSGGGGETKMEGARSVRAPAEDAVMDAVAESTSGGPLSVKSKDVVRDAPLKAGSTDDNADFKGYLKFLETWTTRGDVRGDYQPLDVAGRVFVRVVDGDKRPLPGVAITVSDPRTKAPLWKATTYGDGQAPYYPRLFGPAAQQGGQLEVSATIAGAAVTATWDGQSDLTLAGPAPAAAADGMALDVVFLIDTTGSMGDELERIKTSLLAVADQLRGKRADLKLRFAAVAYKDINDDYVTMAHPFTEDTAAFNTAMQALSAGGGGDLPESLNQGLSRVAWGLQWRPEAAKVVFLVADAAPQMRFKGDVLYGDSAVRAVELGIRVHSVAASGLDPLGTLVLRQIAQLTRGKFIFIEYGTGTQETAAKHGVSGPVEGGNNLDEILLKQLTAEIEGWGKG